MGWGIPRRLRWAGAAVRAAKGPGSGWLLAVVWAVLGTLHSGPVMAQEPPGVGGSPRDIVCYAGGQGVVEFHAVLQLSDNSLLIGGGADNFDWLPSNTTIQELAGVATETAPTGRVPFLLHLSSDLQTIHNLVRLPDDCGSEVAFIKTTSPPGQPTGVLYMSGSLTADKDKKIRPGYFLARLNGNFVDVVPTQAEWVKSIWYAGREHPWDVASDGKVVYARGGPHGYDWMSVSRLRADGEPDVVPDWRTHWYEDAAGQRGEFYGPAGEAPGTVFDSGIVLKTWGRGDFRSWNRDDFLLKTADGNGGVKQGKWPLDAMFSGYFDQETKKTADVTGTGKGYYGYRFGATPCANISVVTIDRRTNDIYLGGNNKSRLPDGKPDFEPWVVAMSPTGELRWWQRLYSEEKGVSTPDQYVDALTIDYSQPLDSGGGLLVVARSHGNNVNNIWNGNAVQHPANPGHGFQDGFTGTHGNMHFSWLGRLSLDAGTLLNCSYLAEYSEGAKHDRRTFDDPLIDHWPHWRSGWPDLNTTRVEPLPAVDDHGCLYLVAMGRRPITTKNAFQQMPSPLAQPGSKGQWSNFVRVYSPDLTRLHYSSIVSGPWDWTTGQGQGPVDLKAAIPVDGGLLVVGLAPADKKTGELVGNDMPTRNVPAWGQSQRTAPMAVIGKLHFDHD